MPTFLKFAAIAAVACAIIAGTAEAGQRGCCQPVQVVPASVDPCPPSPCAPVPVDPCDNVTPIPGDVMPLDGGVIVPDQVNPAPITPNVTPPAPNVQPSDDLNQLSLDTDRRERAVRGTLNPYRGERAVQGTLRQRITKVVNRVRSSRRGCLGR